MEDIFSEAKTRWIFLWSVLSFIGLMILLSIFRVPMDINIMISVFIAIYIIPALWFQSHLKDDDLHVKDFFKKPENRPSSSTFLGTIFSPMLISFGSLGILLALTWRSLPEHSRDVVLMVSQEEPSFSVLTIIFLLTLIISPIFEEIIFRGYLLGRMSYKFGVGKGIIISSIIFGILHGLNFIGATIIGIILCVVFIKTGSLIIPTLMHILYNVCVTVIDTFQSTNGLLSMLNDTNLVLIILIGILLIGIGFAWLIFFMKKNWWEAKEKGYMKL